MKRTNFYFPQPMLDELRAASEKLDVPISELIRKAVAEWLKAQTKPAP